MNSIDPRARAAALSCWSGPVMPEPLKGGITNANFVVIDRGRRHFVRIGDDIIVHGILRFHELAALVEQVPSTIRSLHLVRDLVRQCHVDDDAGKARLLVRPIREGRAETGSGRGF